MPAYKNKDNGSWYVVTQYTDWTGARKQKCKRGFATRRDAIRTEKERPHFQCYKELFAS
ncbi:MAG: Arm DNA-binding domain-containing protein [Oscillospiraceae bacterium]|nr:Arm DNA-binding domain-containing protein [Oscillospiraceae bacterium]